MGKIQYGRKEKSGVGGCYYVARRVKSGSTPTQIVGIWCHSKNREYDASFFVFLFSILCYKTVLLFDSASSSSGEGLPRTRLWPSRAAAPAGGGDGRVGRPGMEVEKLFLFSRFFPIHKRASVRSHTVVNWTMCI